MRKKGMVGLLILSMLVTGVNLIPQNVEKTEAETANVTTVTIDRNATYSSNNGVFEGWGTSLCWFGNRIGGSEQTSADAAKVLCNEEEGLGLDIIRFNIGGGDDPSHTHITRTDSKMPGYWGSYDAATDTFTYDFTKDANQRNVLKKMQAENEDLTVEAFSNSAPYFMTVSGCTSGIESGLADNLKVDKYDDFAEYMAQVIKYYKENYGVTFTSVEPMNENGWSIERNGNKQEGCTFLHGDSQSKMILSMEEALKNNGLEDVILAGCDESTASETVTSLENLSEEAKNALERIDTHTYGVGREDMLRKMTVEMGKNLWMSETDGGEAVKNAGEMGAALSFAAKIQQGMNILQPSAWIMWQAIGSYCDTEPYAGNTDPASLNQLELDTNGFWGVTYADMNQEKVVLTKKYYAFGQYTRYIEKGDIMIKATDGNVVAYDAEKNELKIVVVNATPNVKNMKYDLTGFEFENPTVEVIRTSGDMQTGENWKKLENISTTNEGFQTELEPYSVTTFVLKKGEAPKETTVDKVTKVKATKLKTSSAVISWKKVDGARYKVVYTTNKKKLTKVKNGTGKAVAGTKVKSVSTNKITLKGLKKNTTYYVKVCAYQKDDSGVTYGKYSSTVKLKTKK